MADRATGFDVGGDTVESAFEKTDGVVRMTDFGKGGERVREFLPMFI